MFNINLIISEWTGGCVNDQVSACYGTGVFVFGTNVNMIVGLLIVELPLPLGRSLGLLAQLHMLHVRQNFVHSDVPVQLHA